MLDKYFKRRHLETLEIQRFRTGFANETIDVKETHLRYPPRPPVQVKRETTPEGRTDMARRISARFAAEYAGRPRSLDGACNRCLADLLRSAVTEGRVDQRKVFVVHYGKVHAPGTDLHEKCTARGEELKAEGLTIDAAKER